MSAHEAAKVSGMSKGEDRECREASRTEPSGRQPGPAPDPQPNPLPDPGPDPKPDPHPDPKPDPRPDPMPDPRPDPMPDPRPTPRPGAVWEALEDVLDPELPISIVDLGLVYDVRVNGRTVELDVTFTATGCPCVEFIQQDIRDRLLREPAIDAVEINIVWDPPWTRERLTPRGRERLRAFGVSA